MSKKRSSTTTGHSLVRGYNPLGQTPEGDNKHQQVDHLLRHYRQGVQTAGAMTGIDAAMRWQLISTTVKIFLQTLEPKTLLGLETYVKQKVLEFESV